MTPMLNLYKAKNILWQSKTRRTINIKFNLQSFYALTKLINNSESIGKGIGTILNPVRKRLSPFREIS